MAKFSSFKLTNKGIDLEYKAQLGKTLKFTRFGLGDGELGTTPIKELTDLKHEVLSREIIKLKYDGKKVTIGFMLNNREVTKGFYWKELGIFAEDPDTKEEILLKYATAGETSDFIPAFEDGNMLERYVDVDLYISDVENITAIIDSSLVYSTQKDYEVLKNEITEFKTKIEDKVEEIESKLHETIIISKNEPEQDCIWYQVLRTRPIGPTEDEVLMMETARLDGTEIYISEIDNQEEKVLNIDENLKDDGDVIFEEVGN